MTETVELSTILPATPKEVYEAWLSSDGHSKMTGGEAHCTAIIGDSFSTWDDYITGTNIRLEEFSEIEQFWRTNQFLDSDDDSHLLIRLKPHDDGTELTLIHTKIPERQTQYIRGWQEHYFEPMTEYFNKKSE